MRHSHAAATKASHLLVSFASWLCEAGPRENPNFQFTIFCKMLIRFRRLLVMLMLLMLSLVNRSDAAYVAKWNARGFV